MTPSSWLTPTTVRPRSVRWRDLRGLALTDWVMTGVALGLMITVAASDSRKVDDGLLLVLLVAGWTPLLVRNRWPIIALFSVVAVEGIHLFAVPLVAPVEFNSVPAAVMVVCYTIGVRRDWRTAWVCGGSAALILLVLGSIARPGDQVAANMFALDLVLGATAAGVLVRSRFLRLAAMERRALLAEQTREEEARRQVASERLRMARELHDVVAHNLALVNAQSSVAEYLIRTDPEAAARALQNLTEHTRQALDELRATVGLLRQEGEAGDESRRPVSVLADLPALVERHRTSGMEVSLVVKGDAQHLPSLSDLAAYRIVQEALTNARKHAPGSDVTVELTWTAGELRLQVANGPSPVAPPEHRGEGTGHGLLGMRERAHAAHGTLSAEARPDGGFTVVAHIPIHAVKHDQEEAS
jgi:signal transduction histidine kinase